MGGGLGGLPRGRLLRFRHPNRGRALSKALTIPLPDLPAEALSDADADRLSAYVAQATAEALRDYLLEMRVRKVFEAERDRLGYDGALHECEARLPVSFETARRIVQGRWTRQPENRGV